MPSMLMKPVAKVTSAELAKLLHGIQPGLHAGGLGPLHQLGVQPGLWDQGQDTGHQLPVGVAAL